MKRIGLAIAGLAVIASLAGCDIKGTQCDNPGSTKTDARSHHTYTCQHDKQTGANTWQ